ncbi:MAG: hypothetical protein JWM72_2710 [Actinomycetia bacterium]|jgi:hypothetical protein|nr:hypothetical protein [Actinomycetes bacterium]
MDKLKLSTANLIIIVSGAVMLIASFLPFNKFSTGSFNVGGVHVGGTITYNAWSSHYFLIATIPALLGIVMAAQVAVVAFASGVRLPETVLGFTWNQIHLVFAFQATIMMLAFLIQNTSPLDKGIGLFLMLLAAIALLVGAVLRMQEQPTGAI